MQPLCCPTHCSGRVWHTRTHTQSHATGCVVLPAGRFVSVITTCSSITYSTAGFQNRCLSELSCVFLHPFACPFMCMCCLCMFYLWEGGYRQGIASDPRRARSYICDACTAHMCADCSLLKLVVNYDGKTYLTDFYNLLVQMAAVSPSEGEKNVTSAYVAPWNVL